MCLTEYDEAKTMEMFREEGREEGRIEGRIEGEKKGQHQFAELIHRLQALGRESEIFTAASDPEYLDKLFKEFKMA